MSNTRKVYSKLEQIPSGHASDKIVKGCLVIEGGAFRGVYNEGVLDALIKHDYNFECTIGVSAGALGGMNYVAGQVGRSARCNLGYRHDFNYVGLGALKESNSILRLDFIFDDFDRIEPLDKERFYDKSRKYIAVATDCESGEPMYFDRDNCSDIFKAIKASASMPYVSPMVELDGHEYLDGACSVKIPYKWALEQNYDKIVIIKTMENGFRLKNKDNYMAQKVYHRYPKLAAKLERTNAIYNAECDDIDELGRSGRAFVIAPSEPVTVKQVESDMEKLGELYWLGYRDGINCMNRLEKYLMG